MCHMQVQHAYKARKYTVDSLAGKIDSSFHALHQQIHDNLKAHIVSPFNSQAVRKLPADMLTCAGIVAHSPGLGCTCMQWHTQYKRAHACHQPRCLHACLCALQLYVKSYRERRLDSRTLLTSAIHIACAFKVKLLGLQVRGGSVYGSVQVVPPVVQIPECAMMLTSLAVFT